jgi:hypothetical protein
MLTGEQEASKAIETKRRILMRQIKGESTNEKQLLISNTLN